MLQVSAAKSAVRILVQTCCFYLNQRLQLIFVVIQCFQFDGTRTSGNIKISCLIAMN